VAAEVNDHEAAALIPAQLGVVPGDRQIVDDQVVVGCPADLRQRGRLGLGWQLEHGARHPVDVGEHGLTGWRSSVAAAPAASVAAAPAAPEAATGYARDGRVRRRRSLRSLGVAGRENAASWHRSWLAHASRSRRHLTRQRWPVVGVAKPHRARRGDGQPLHPVAALEDPVGRPDIFE